jgi:NADPH-dependent glutamate synthase beta subunit-like oxidoreductase/NAD(P)H-flavin reductase
MTELRLAFGFAFADLHARDGLVRLDRAFVDWLTAADPVLAERLLAARAAPEALAPLDESALLIDLGAPLERFLAMLFGIEEAVDALVAETRGLDPLWEAKRNFVQRRALKAHRPDAAAGFDGAALAAALETAMGEALTEAAFARHVARWSAEPQAHEAALDTAERYAAWAALTPEGRARHVSGVLFRAPRRIDPAALVPVERIARDGVTMLRLPPHEWRERDAFHLTDRGMDRVQALDQVNYCIWCHPQGKDSCARGLKDRKTGAFQKSAHGVTLAGCPLEEKISEMHMLRARGHALAALATIAVDNPLCAGTGHRICNDCMKACIYQKQEPVDIPQAETRVLKDVLGLPWGFEIYALLTRWNPLDLRRPLPRPPSGRSVLVVGLGPAGYTLAHHLLNDGHDVVAIDGLKIEPLDPALSGVAADGARVARAPVRDIAALTEDLDTRVLAGFGGVAEYGITVRWDKNFLKLIRLLLERRAQFAMHGGVRFGGTLTLDDAWAMGFDHVALCMGAGRPTVIPMKNGLARGVRQASDFLMALQLTGAAKTSSLANLQLRMPIVVIGGGLTAIDTATESLAYYARQVEKFLARHAALAAEGAAPVHAGEDAEIAAEFLAHGAAIRDERAAAAREGRAPRLRALLEAWGGATIAYRRGLADAPSFTLNHEEVAKAMEEGVRFAEGLTPVEVVTDRHGHAAALKLTRKGDAGDPQTVALPARAILVAAGTQPNTVLAREDGRIRLDGRYFEAIDETGARVAPERAISKPASAQVLMHRTEDGRYVSFFGDLHPSFFGNVVKAMGSAKRGYPVVSRVLAARPPVGAAPAALRAHLADALGARVHAVHRLTPTIVEVVVEAPAAARNFRPGQFYRLQNFEAEAPRIDDTVLGMEGLAMTGAWTDPARGLVSVIALEMGGSSDLCAVLRPGERVVLMGPTGAPTETPGGETVALVGGGLGNAVLFSIGRALRAAGSRVVYFAGYKKLQDRYKVDEIEAAADVVIWCCDEAPGFAPTRPQDKSFVGNIVAAMRAYGVGELGAQPVALAAADRIVAIGSDRMMAAVAQARHGVLAPLLKPAHCAIGSINSPMQCMMKEICAQCLQRWVDPRTGEESVVFSCFNQDQPLDRVDWAMLNDRLRQNAVAERQTRAWLDRCLRRLELRPAAEAGASR